MNLLVKMYQLYKHFFNINKYLMNPIIDILCILFVFFFKVRYICLLLF